MTEVDVLLPVRNGATYLQQAMHSILTQTHQDLRLIVLDDGSTDASRDLALQLAADDERVEVVALEPMGLPAALNAGLERVTAPWIARMDADDISEPDRIARQLASAALNTQVVGWATWAHGMTSDGRVTTLMPRGPVTVEEFERAHAAGPLDVNGATVLLRTEVVRQVGGWDPNFDYAEDVELYDRMGDAGPLLTVAVPLYRIRIHGDGHWQRGLDRSLQIGRYLHARRRAARAGQTLAFDEFRRADEDHGVAMRMRRKCDLIARRWHHRATIYAMEGRMLMALIASIPVAVAKPAFFIGRAARYFERRRLGRRLELSTLGEDRTESSDDGSQ